MKVLEIKLQTRTPLWTGGIGGKTDRLHETGIIGSLRWWYEAIVRGLGGEACDPTTHKCPDKNGNVCDVCALFGATGLKRGFRIDWDPPENEDENSRLQVKVQNNRGWYLKNGLSFDELGGAFYATRKLNWLDTDDDLWQILNVVLTLNERYAGLGAQTQQGYGVFSIPYRSVQLEERRGIAAINRSKQRANRKTNVSHGLPSLENFFFAKIQFAVPSDRKGFILARTTEVSRSELDEYLSANILPIAPIIRYHLRALIREDIQFKGKPNAATRWILMGVLNGTYHQVDFGKMVQEDWFCTDCKRAWRRKPRFAEHGNCRGKPYQRLRCQTCHKILPSYGREIVHLKQQKSAIHVSHAYLAGNRWEFRLWGYIPPSLPGNVSRDTVLGVLKTWLGIPENAISTDWITPAGGELWSKNRCAIPPETLKIHWTEKFANETGEAYLTRLLTMDGAS